MGNGPSDSCRQTMTALEAPESGRMTHVLWCFPKMGCPKSSFFLNLFSFNKNHGFPIKNHPFLDHFLGHFWTPPPLGCRFSRLVRFRSWELGVIAGRRVLKKWGLFYGLLMDNSWDYMGLLGILWDYYGIMIIGIVGNMIGIIGNMMGLWWMQRFATLMALDEGDLGRLRLHWCLASGWVRWNTWPIACEVHRMRGGFDNLLLEEQQPASHLNDSR